MHPVSLFGANAQSIDRFGEYANSLPVEAKAVDRLSRLMARSEGYQLETRYSGVSSALRARPLRNVDSQTLSTVLSPPERFLESNI